MTDISATDPAVDSRAPVSPHVERPAPGLAARDAAAVLVLAALPLLATLGGGYVADDFFFVTILEHITQPFAEYLAGAVTAMRDVPTTFYRPLAMASLLAEIRAFDSDPWPLHASNLVLHALTATAVWGIARRLVSGPHARGAAIFAALAWAWFPRRVETVAWISCRPDLLATGLATVGLWMWIEGARAHRTPLRAAGVLAWGLALFAKESVVALPLALVAWPALDGQRPPADPLRRFGRLAARVVALWPFVVVLAAYLTVRRLASGVFIGGYGASSLVFWSDSTLKHLVYPAIPPLEFLNRWLLEPGAFLPVAAVVAGLTLALWFAVWRTRSTPAVSFGALWWVAGALPAMPFLPSLTTTFNDRLMYLSGIGFALVLGGWWVRGGRRARAILAACLVLVTVQTVAIAARWPVAGDLTARLVEGVAAASAQAAPAQPILVAAAPDSYRGAYVLRNGLAYALQRQGVADPARVVVLSHYLLDTVSAMPVEARAEGASAVRLRGRDGRPEVMISYAATLPYVTYEASDTDDRYGRRADVLMQVRVPALLLVAAPSGVATLGTIGPGATTDPQVAPRVGPRE
ncbi:MAG: hypothetical protein MUF60_01340 [Vicinamibacterales bacterium]|nr:hypothetical protein [Vicinamibacterales bacterium]